MCHPLYMLAAPSCLPLLPAGQKAGRPDSFTSVLHTYRHACAQSRLPVSSASASVSSTPVTVPPPAAANHHLPGQYRPPAALAAKAKPAHLLRVDEQGREIDEQGKVVYRKRVEAVTSLKVRATFAQLVRAPACLQDSLTPAVLSQCQCDTRTCMQL